MKNIRKDFPIFTKPYNGTDLVYLDNASTTQKPQAMLDAVTHFYTTHNASVGRGVYALAEQATADYEAARKKVANFIKACDAREIVFTSGTTEGINAVAYAWAKKNLHAGDEIVITQIEHHSNILPWQALAQEYGFVLKYIPVEADGSINYDTLDKIITKKTKLISVAHISNFLGVHLDVVKIIHVAHAVGAKVLVDAAQSISHQKIDVQKLDVDFLTFSGHKMFGPTGVGALYIKKELHDQLRPFNRGGGMVYEADFHETSYLKMPQLLEAGTPYIAQAIGLGAAIDYINRKIDFAALQTHESMLCTQLIDGFETMNKVRVLGNTEQLKQNGHLVSFVVEGMHPHDVAAFVDQFGICVRAGHHCVQPFSKKIGVAASVRASFSAYNTLFEVDELISAIEKITL